MMKYVAKMYFQRLGLHVTSSNVRVAAEKKWHTQVAVGEAKRSRDGHRDRQAERHTGGIHPFPHPFEYWKEGPTSGATSLWIFYKRIFAFDPLFFRQTSQALWSTAANALYFDLPSRNPLKRQLRQTRLYLSIVLLYPSSFTSPGPVSTEVLSSFCCQEPI